jgi:hypothetical protein
MGFGLARDLVKFMEGTISGSKIREICGLCSEEMNLDAEKRSLPLSTIIIEKLPV